MVSLIWVVVGILVVAVVLALIFWLVSRSKGKIAIELSKFQFSPGDTIEGKVSLNLKKPVSANALKVGLIGIYKNTNYNAGGSGVSKSTRSGYAFDFRQPIDGQKEYPAGEKVYDFKLNIPQDLLTSQNSTLGNVMKSAMALTGKFSSIQWYVVANLDMAGFDLSKKVQVNIG